MKRKERERERERDARAGLTFPLLYSFLRSSFAVHSRNQQPWKLETVDELGVRDRGCGDGAVAGGEGWGDEGECEVGEGSVRWEGLDLEDKKEVRGILSELSGCV